MSAVSDNAWRFNSEFDHVEYWHYWVDGTDHAPYVYPTVSQYAYSSIELLGEAADPEKTVSGTVTLRFRCKGNDASGQEAKVYLADKHIATCEVDDNGMFEATYDTALLQNGYNRLQAIVGERSFNSYIKVQNLQFEILDWKDEILSVSEPYEVRVKGYLSTGEITDCKVKVWLDDSRSGCSGTYAVAKFNSDGLASFVIDPEKCSEGLHRLSIFYLKPGEDSQWLDSYNEADRSFRVSHSAADSGNIRFWGTSASSDRNVGDWADFRLKYDGTVTEQCKFSVTMDNVPVTPFIPDGDKVTDFFDKDGYCTFYLDVTGQSNGKHTVQVALTKEDGSTVTASNTVNVTDGYCKLELWRYTDDGQLDPYTDRNTAINGYVRINVRNTSGTPSGKCRVWFYEDDMLTYDLDIQNRIKFNSYNPIDSVNDCFTVEISSPELHFGKHVLKVVFMSGDGTIVEKNRPFQLNPKARFYDDLHFSVTNHDEVRKVGQTVDFTLNYDTPFPACKDLRITVDGEPADIQIPDDPASAFDYFGRFFFTLDFTDKQRGEHTIEAMLTKEDGAVMTAKQVFCVTDDYFTVTNWPKGEPVLDRVCEVKVKNLTDTEVNVCSVRQYIDGEDMGAVPFDGNGMATLSLNTAGLEKGTHSYKVVFTNSEGGNAEKYMRFRVK